MHPQEPNQRTVLLPASDATAGAQGQAVAHPMAAMLTQNVLHNGELILLAIKPSLFYIPFSCLKFCATVLILMIVMKIWGPAMGEYHVRTYIEIGTLLLVGRLTWAAMQWMSRLYILTDMRIVSVTGVFTVDIFNCQLRKIARTRMFFTFKERLLGLGTIEIIPMDEDVPTSMWQTVSHARAVHKEILAAMNRARQRTESQ